MIFGESKMILFGESIGESCRILESSDQSCGFMVHFGNSLRTLIIFGESRMILFYESIGESCRILKSTFQSNDSWYILVIL